MDDLEALRAKVLWLNQVYLELGTQIDQVREMVEALHD